MRSDLGGSQPKIASLWSDLSSSSQRGWALRAALAAGLLLVGFAVFSGTRDRGATDVSAVGLLSDQGLVPTVAVANPTAVETTAPIPVPTALPTPTAIAIPEPTPEFGPTGRPSSAAEVKVLTAKSFVSRPTVYDSPDGSEVGVSYTYLDGTVDPVYDHFSNPTYFGNSLAMMVLSGSEGDEWAEVSIPTRPTTSGWVKTEDFDWSSSDYYIQINIGDNTVKAWKGDEVLVDSTPVVTGDAGRVTPVASTYVDEIMPGPSGAYGPWLLSLALFSESINTFGGGLPKVALHGTNRPDLLGQYASNGCIRLPNEVITLLAAEVPPGTRVDIVDIP